MNDARLTSRLSFLLAVVAVVWLAGQIVPLLQSIGDILLLFFLAWLVSFILEPLVAVQERLRVPRSLAVAMIYSVLLIGLTFIGVLLAPPLVAQLRQLRESLPGLVAQLPPEEAVTSFFTGLGLPVSGISAIYRPDLLAQQLQTSAGGLLQGAIALATSALGLIVNVLLLLIISFYMLLDGRKLTRSFLRLLPEARRDDAVLVLDQVAASFGGFLRGQVIQSVLFGLTVAALMIALGMDFVAVAALSSAGLMLIPLLGPVLSLAPPLIVALFHPQDVVLATLVTLGIVQAAIVNVLMPRILSGQMGLPPLLVFAAILLGLRIGGPLGAFFGIPVMGVVYGTASVILSRWKSGDNGGQKRARRSAEARQGRTKTS